MGFCWNCGAHLRFLSAPESQEHRDLIIFVIGSNDLGDGISQSSIYSQLKGYINEYLDFAKKKVVIKPIFPRSNPSYMLGLAELNNLITKNTSDIVGWRWSKKLDRHMIQHDTSDCLII